MTEREIINRLSRLDIRDAEPEDYAALYLAIQKLSGDDFYEKIVKEGENEE